MIRIGTSGWDYPHWTRRFYAPTLLHAERLAYYARHFDTVEINRSFYRLPTREQFAAWAGEVTGDPTFLFAVKASRYITHFKKLRDAGDALALLVANARGLGAHLGPFLYQLPPHWHADPERLTAFVALLPAGTRNAFEFRDPSWLVPRILDILRAHDCSLVTAVGAPAYAPLATAETGPFRYLRFHTGLYGAGFTHDELAYWAGRIAIDAAAGLDVYAYFNNDPEGHAVRDATALRGLLAAGPAESLLAEPRWI
jgi:uncharacterized protein YecE (DUF72 family)